jgi:hypothetical protein
MLMPHLAAVAQQGFEARGVLRGADQQDVADAGQHQRGQRVIHHGLVVHRQQLLADGQRGRVQPGAGSAGQDDALAGRCMVMGGAVQGPGCRILHFGQHARAPLPATAAGEAEGLAQARGVQRELAGRARASGRRWWARARSRRWHLERLAGIARACSINVGGIAVPAWSRPWRQRGTCQTRRVVQRHRNGVGGHVGQQVGAGGGAELVGHHGEAVALLCQAQHGLGEVAAPRCVHPARAEDQVLAAAGANGSFAVELGLAVDAERARGESRAKASVPLPSKT